MSVVAFYRPVGPQPSNTARAAPPPEAISPQRALERAQCAATKALRRYCCLLSASSRPPLTGGVAAQLSPSSREPLLAYDPSALRQRRRLCRLARTSIQPTKS